MKVMDHFIPLSKPSISEHEIAYVTEVLRSGWWTTGPKVAAFEQAVCDYLGGGLHAVGLNSCTGGLFLSLLAHGIGPGDEVIVPTWTFAATGHVVLWTGAGVVLCDVEPDTLNIDPARVEELITPRTKAIMPVHVAGRPCDQEALGDLARRHGLIIVEDAAHAIGLPSNGSMIGAQGNTTVFSFYATKNLACGEGGMVVTSDEALADRVRSLSYFGINKKAFERYTERGTWYYEIEGLGYKYNMDSMHAALGLAQLERLDAMNARRREIAAYYRANLPGEVTCLAEAKGDEHIYHLFVVKLDPALDRDQVCNGLKERRVGSSVHYIPLHRHPYYRHLDQGQFPVADEVYPRALSLPLYPDLSDAEAEYVVEAVKDVLKSGGGA